MLGSEPPVIRWSLRELSNGMCAVWRDPEAPANYAELFDAPFQELTPVSTQARHETHYWLDKALLNAISQALRACEDAGAIAWREVRQA